ncbi:MAG: QueT transporter family protein, partial [Clostridia bacterium]|nr:QueT transporter family protein [Clostridia bacterium]
MKMTKTRYVSHAAIISAIYVVLTYLTNLIGLANGAVQCRLSEALCVLPAFTPAAIPGLFIGCFLSNLLTGCALPDIVFGSAATLLGAYGTKLLSQRGCSKYLLSLPAI